MHTSDPMNQQINLSISGSVEAIASIKPKRVKLSGLAGVPISETVTIIPREKYPFKILETRAQRGKNIRYRLKEEKNSENTIYLLTVENMRQEKGNYYDKIELITDNRHRKKILINVYGSILEPEKRKDTN